MKELKITLTFREQIDIENAGSVELMIKDFFKEKGIPVEITQETPSTAKPRHINDPARVSRRQEIVAQLTARGVDYITASQEALDIEEKEEAN